MDAKEMIEAIERESIRRRNPALREWEEALDVSLADAYGFSSDTEAAEYVNGFEAEPDTDRIIAQQPAVMADGKQSGALEHAAAGSIDTGIGRYHGHIVRDYDAHRAGEY